MSDSDEEFIVDKKIEVLRDKIIERLCPYNYLKICINVIWICELKDADHYQKVSLAVMVLESIGELRQLRQYHYSMVENLYALAEHPDRLNRLKKRIGWGQWILSWFIYT